MIKSYLENQPSAESATPAPDHRCPECGRACSAVSTLIHHLVSRHAHAGPRQPATTHAFEKREAMDTLAHLTNLPMSLLIALHRELGQEIANRMVRGDPAE